MSTKNNKNKLKQLIIEILLIIVILLIGYFNPNFQETINNIINEQTESTVSYNLNDIPEYEDKPGIIIYYKTGESWLEE